MCKTFMKLRDFDRAGLQNKCELGTILQNCNQLQPTTTNRNHSQPHPTRTNHIQPEPTRTNHSQPQSTSNWMFLFDETSLCARCGLDQAQKQLDQNQQTLWLGLKHLIWSDFLWQTAGFGRH